MFQMNDIASKQQENCIKKLLERAFCRVEGARARSSKNAPLVG
jgi:hypothetical protein